MILLGSLASLAVVASAAGHPAAGLPVLREYQVRFDGTDKRQIGVDGTTPLPNSMYAMGASRSADGRYYSLTEGAALYVGDTANLATPPQLVTPVPTSPPAFYVLPPGLVRTTARFTPSGDLLTFTARSITDSPDGIVGHAPDAIYVVRSNGSDLHRVSRHGRSSTISSDGKTVAFVQGNWPHRSVYTVPVKGGTPRKIASGFAPVFAPRGNLLAYISSDNAVAIASAGGVGPRQILGHGVSGVVWSASGREIAWGGLKGGVLVAGAYDGWKVHHVLWPLKNGGGPIALSPDGKRLAYFCACDLRAPSGGIWTTNTTPGSPRYFVTADPGAATVLFENNTQLTYLADATP